MKKPLDRKKLLHLAAIAHHAYREGKRDVEAGLRLIDGIGIPHANDNRKPQ